MSGIDESLNLKTLHQNSDGITPYLRCPWCGYMDVIGEFLPYFHPDQPMDMEAGTKSTQCADCRAAGPTALFVLACPYNSKRTLGDDEPSRDMYLSELAATPHGVDDE